MLFFTLLFLPLFISSLAQMCQHDFPDANNGNVKRIKKSSISITTGAIYDIKMINNWTKRNHPRRFPVSSAHWSPPVMASHNANYQMWKMGKLASSAVEAVAEAGSTGQLTTELNNQGLNILDYKVGRNQFDKMQVISQLTVNEQHPYISAISMIAPSPDWFSGFNDVVPVSCDGTWFKQFFIVVGPYDAGTEDGATYSLNNSPTDPQEPIQLITRRNIADPKVFVKRGKVRPVLKFKFTLRDTTV